MNFRQLEYIQMIQREGSISGAAKKLFITQSALSQQLLKAEEEIGAPIFDRATNPLKPTYFGEQYLVYVQKILLEYEESNKLVQSLGNSHKGRLVVGIPSNRSVQLLPTLMPKFIQKYPNIQLVIRERNSFELDQMILEGTIDFSIMVSPSSSPSIMFVPLIREELFLAVPETSKLNLKHQGREPYIEMEECKEENFILMKKGHRLYDVAKQLFKTSCFEPKILLETGNVDLARRIVAEGAGVCFSSQLAAAMNPLVHSPVYYSIGKNGIFWELGISYHKDKYVSRTMQLFFESVREEIEINFNKGK